MNKPKRHHYVAQFYQGFFAKDNLLWVYDRVDDSYKHLPPKHIAVKTGFYAHKGANGTKNYEVETQLCQKIDSDASTAIRELEEGHELSEKNKQVIAVFAAFQLLRVPEFEAMFNELSEKMTKTGMRAYLSDINKVKTLLDKLEPGISEEDVERIHEMFQNPDSYQLDIPQELRLAASLENIAPVANMLLNMQWRIIAAHCRTSFILTDNPFIVVPPAKPLHPLFGSGGLTVPGATKIMPLTPNFCLCIGDFGAGVSWYKAPREVARAMNLELAARSTRQIMARDKAHLESIVKLSNVKNLERKERIKVG